MTSTQPDGEEETRITKGDAAEAHSMHRSGADDEATPPLRLPTPADGAGVWELVREAGSLDLNSPYAYLLLCSDFRDSGVIAPDPSRPGGIGGFVLGYRRPQVPDAWFVWQVAVAPEQRGRGLGGRMLAWGMQRQPDAHFLEATVTPSNEASRALFRGFARRHGLGWHEELAFGKSLFPAGDHEEEIRIRIGPREGRPAPAEEETR